MSFGEFAVSAVARMFCSILAVCCFMLAAGSPSWAVSAVFDGAMIGMVIGLLICFAHYKWVEEGSFWGLLMLARVPPPVVVVYSIDTKHLARFFGK